MLSLPTLVPNASSADVTAFSPARWDQAGVANEAASVMTAANLPLMRSTSASIERPSKPAFDEDGGTLARVVKWRNARGVRALCWRWSGRLCLP
jgi:hypothetical protein